MVDYQKHYNENNNEHELPVTCDRFQMKTKLCMLPCLKYVETIISFICLGNKVVYYWAVNKADLSFNAL